MLAERKQKQKWSLNPRGKIWSEDSNKFGQKLLEKMGWSAGKGLGAKGDGITEHIKVRYKNDCQGIGFKESDDQWTQHEDKFSELLSSLSGCKESDKDSSTQLQSLEKKSKTSKARVHYHKFTRGKDLSRYSEKDLANIFGKKSLKEEVREETPEVVEDTSGFGTTPVKKNFAIEMPIIDEEVMLNVVNTPVVKKENDGKHIERRKRFSDVNQSINSMDSSADLRKNGHGGFDNEGYDEVGNQIEENIDTLSKQLDDYQAEVENDLNEAKMEVMVGEMGDPDGENEILPNGDVKLKFKYADFRKISRWYRKNGEVNAKTSYRHLIKGDIVLGFKNTNLDNVLGYKRITKQVMGGN